MAFQPKTAAGAQAATQKPGHWESRVEQAAYTSPGGTRVEFDHEDVGRSTEKRSAVFAFIGVNEEYVQDNGHGSRRYPMRCFFNGPKHDQLATVMEAALLESGIGRLSHPFYGTFNVIPFGEITRRDDLKTSANQTVIEVTFWTTVGAVYPSSRANPKNEIQAALDRFNGSAAQQFADGADLESGLQKANLKSAVRNVLRSVSGVLEKASDAVAAVNREFRDLQSLVNFGLDALVGQPLILAQQIANLITAPGRALAGLRLRLQGYRDLAQRIFGQSRASSADRSKSQSLRSQAVNDFRLADLSAQAAVAGSVTTVLNHTFTRREEALSAAEEVLDQLDIVVTWREGRFDELNELDTGESYQSIQEAVALTIGYLVEISFSLIPERAIILDRERTIIDLCAELYGNVDNDQIDFLVTSNELTGDEIILLPRQKKISYYSNVQAA